MEFYTNAGLGDILIVKIYDENSPIKITTIGINQECIESYTHNPETYKLYIFNYAKFLFPSIEKIIFSKTSGSIIDKNIQLFVIIFILKVFKKISEFISF